MIRYREDYKSITQEQLKEILDYNRETGEFHWKFNPKREQKWNTRYSGKRAGTVNKDGRRTISIEKVIYLASRLAWLYEYGVWPVSDLDHKDTNPGNDRILNLREATFGQNNSNQGLRSSNQSEHKCISWCKQTRKWRVLLKKDGKSIDLGRFADKSLAIEVYRANAPSIYGEFYRDE